MSAVGSRRPPTANATKASSSQMTMVVHGRRALIRAKRSVTGTVLYPLTRGVPGNRRYCSKPQDSKSAASVYERIEITGPTQMVERALTETIGRSKADRGRHLHSVIPYKGRNPPNTLRPRPPFPVIPDPDRGSPRHTPNRNTCEPRNPRPLSPPSPRRRPEPSNCLEGQAFRAWSASHLAPCLTMALRMVSSLRMHAVRATFRGFPAFNSRS